MTMHPSSSIVAALTVALALSGAGRLPAQEAGSHDGCVTPAERRSDDGAGSGLHLSGGEPTEGYHGIVYGGEVSMASLEDGGPVRWKDPPVVEGVYCGSPAHGAGLQEGDLILAVNGADARRPGVLKATEPDMVFHLLVRREGRQLRLEIRTVPRPPAAR